MTVFPIGHYMGERHPESLHYVRVGLEHQTMTTDEFGVWVLSHQDSPQWSVEDVVRLASQAELPNAPESVERLLSAGLLAQATTPVDFTRAYRLYPLQVGLGNTPENPDEYAVGLPDQEPAVLSATAYELWQWSALAPTLWHTCEIRAKVSENPAEDEAAGVLADLRPILANSCGYLDVRR
ncbi:hypothetical protein [Actinophytocola oryzae]|uniref:Uncharacterized protein n=1 Tax=Actinophytocola oryzae TaxID=502181 RepID=A0A4R7UTW0_9PSEU|nr:hypothetical protein [Actinophytocola oryzae]TDV40079.1 hypothetical protein CLV71_12496 [Actinophytocola oryzae]